MKSYDAATSIAARPDAVWDGLSDVTHWPDWDSGITRVDGDLMLGGNLTIRSEAAQGRSFPVKVTTLDPPRRLVLSGGMPLGLFRGVRTYSLEADGGHTLVEMREDYTGPLLGPVWRSMPDLQPSFDRFVHGLERRVMTGN